ncbi:helix-turn-helix transcriptional regulator [[Actinomadura] parvosata]|uniref:helix-turn-helix transcriptional regulator n=1 Tax=[Actinomadura] parvosata TaxID=1955412 RepID=UPI00406D35D6
MPLLARAAELLGIRTVAAAPPAETAGLITIGTRARFRHPLARTAAYRAAAPEDRRQAHRALADATDARSDPDRRAWHLANATDGPDETVAAELERTAERARARGGVGAAAAFLKRAAELTPEAGRRGARMLAAARAGYQAGGYDTAFELLDVAELSPLDERELALGGLLRAQATLAVTGAGTAVPLLLEAARRLEPLDAGLAQEAYRDAFNAALTIDRLPDLAQAALAAPPGPPPERNRLLLRGLATMISEGYGSGVPMIRQALDAFGSEGPSGEEDLGWLLLASRAAFHVWDFPSSTALSTRLVNLARETGALSTLPAALLQLASNQVLAGELAHAVTLIAEARATGEATGSRFPAHHASMMIEPWRGGEAATLHAIAALTQDADPHQRRAGRAPGSGHWASAVLYNGLGRYEEAYAAAARAAANLHELGPAGACLAELVEAASRAGRPARAAEAARRFDELAQTGGTDWALGTSALLRAQVSGGPAADALYREAIERLGRARVLIAQARSRLLHGEWLRRQGRRADAREQLSLAYELLDGAGAGSFAERARRELHATGEKARTLPVNAPAALTPQESQIAHLAGEGLTNPEIGAQLFISPHTVEWHLRKVFVKLGIASRKQISIALLDNTAATAWR